MPLALELVGSNLAPVIVLLKVFAPPTVCVVVKSTKFCVALHVPPFATGKVPVTPGVTFALPLNEAVDIDARFV